MKAFRKMKIDREPTTIYRKGFETKIQNSYWKEFSVLKEVSLNTFN